MKTVNSIDFYQRHLDRVSRSFAFCIRKLEPRMRHWVSLTYLVCRVLDTVEDAPWRKSTEQNAEYQRFDRLLNSVEHLGESKDWSQSFPEAIPSGEKILLEDTDKVFQELHAAPGPVKRIIQEMVGSMSAGMQHFSTLRNNGELRLNNVKEVNQYCFFVAGLVGEALSKLLVAVDGSVKAKREMIVNAHHFGLFLQKVNLLKDQLTDEKEGRFFIPNRDEVYESLAINAQGAKHYLEAIPLKHQGYRLFCSWSLYLGLASLPYIQESYRTGKALKISRLETKALTVKIEKLIDKPEAMSALFDEKFTAANLTLKDFAGEKNATREWPFRKFYFGQLENAELAQLGLVT